jgi:cell division protein FtsW
LVVLGLFLVLGYACFRLVARSDDLFVRIATAGAMAWLLGQMLINVGAVIGMLPVIGVPLPLVSSGGSALLTSMVTLGMLMSFARAEPGAAEALGARPGVLRRSLAVLPVRLARASAGRGRTRPSRGGSSRGRRS